MPEHIQCEHSTHERFALGIESEVADDDEYIHCEAEADVVAHPVGMTGAADRAKSVFCDAHAEQVIEDASIPWEYDAADPEDIRPLADQPERADIPNFP